MITRKFFVMRKYSRTSPRPYPASCLYIEFYWCSDTDHAAVFFSDMDECLGEFSRQTIMEKGWI